MKLLLISANPVTTPYPVYPLGLDHVARAVSPPHRVEIIDINSVRRLDGLGERVRAAAPDAVGVAIRNVDNTDMADPVSYLPFHRTAVRHIRNAWDGPIILGGSGFTIFPAEFMAALGADYGIIGEGERLAGLLDALEAGRSPAVLPGVIRPFEVPDYPPPDLDSSPQSAWLDPEAQHVSYYLRRGGMLNLQTHRGCPFRCIYCTYPHIEGRRLRPVPPEAVAKAAVALQAAGARYLWIADSAFNADFNHSAAVADAFRRAGLTIPWGAFFTPTAPPSGYYRHLAEAGLTHVEFGTESLAEPVLFAYGKPFNHEAVFAAHRDAVAAGLHVAHYFLFGGPGETDGTLRQTLSRIDKLEKSVLFLFGGMRIYPHTALYDRAVREGQIDPGGSLLAPVFYRPPGLDAGAMARQIRDRAAGRTNWIWGAGGDETAAILSRLYDRGFTGPLWEQLIR